MTTHKILVNPYLSGFEYGVLYDFQDEIARLTGGVSVEAPHSCSTGLARRMALGMRYAGFRHFLRRSGFEPEADVLWAVMMGPEHWSLDLFRGWDRKVGFKILYLFDTMECQIPTIRRVLNSTKWDVTITSFQGAVPLLEAATQRKWLAVPQGVKLDRFWPASADDRVIDFCAYGRRFNRIHESVKKFCTEHHRHYEYTTTTGLQPGIHACEAYEQYAWHLRHATYNFCWPVEMTHPNRVLSFSPITCRWFEAAASGTVVIGKAPDDPGFADMFGRDFVIPIDVGLRDHDLQCFWRELWEQRSIHLDCARKRYIGHSAKWSWEHRVREILKLTGHSEACEADSGSNTPDIEHCVC